jgi:hypothetical protein
MMSDSNVPNPNQVEALMHHSDQELLARAVAFHAGYAVHANGYILDPNDPPDDIEHHRLTIEFRGAGWAISDGTCCVLNRDGEWVYQPQPSSRTEGFLQQTRWATAQEAFDFLENWRPLELQRALDQEFTVWKRKNDTK